MKEIPGITQRAIDLIKPYEQLYDSSCGPASLHIAYLALGKDIPEDQLVKELDCDDDGTDWEAMLANPQKHGFSVWESHRAKYEDLEDVIKVTGFPVIVPWFSNRGRTEAADHYSVIKKISPLGILLVDPGQGDYYAMEKDEFVKRWSCNNNNKDYMVIVAQI